VKNRWLRFLWTEVGRRIAEPDSECPTPPAGLPASLARALELLPDRMDVRMGNSLLGSQLDARGSRFIYSSSWSILREKRFSRPLRLEPWPGVDLLIPFYREKVCVLPQSFSRRIPLRQRSLSVVGRSRTASIESFRMIAVIARWNDEVVDILERGGVTFCSLDRLEEML
jgi:hypothetical protein